MDKPPQGNSDSYIPPNKQKLLWVLLREPFAFNNTINIHWHKSCPESSLLLNYTYTYMYLYMLSGTGQYHPWVSSTRRTINYHKRNLSITTEGIRGDYKGKTNFTTIQIIFTTSLPCYLSTLDGTFTSHWLCILI